MPMMPDGARPEPKEPFRPSGRQVVGAIIAVLLLVFIITNRDSAEVSLVVTDVTLPLWLVLAITVLLGVVVGMAIGSHRAKRRYRDA
jgi:uncharacterized integral membrane protein